MGRRPAVAQSEVFKAIEKLLDDGEYPTHARLRAAVGGRGSPIVLQRYIGEWYETNGPRLASKATPPSAEQLDVGIRQQLAKATETALAQFDATQAERIAALEARSAALDAVDSDLLAREQRLDARESAHAAHLAELRALLEAAASTQARLEEARDLAIEQAGTYRAQVEALTAVGQLRVSELEQLQAVADHVPTLQAALERSQADAAREQARVVELVGERDRLRRLANERAAELAKVQGQLERADEATTKQATALAGVRQQLETANSLLASSSGEVSRLKEALSSAQEAHAEIERERVRIITQRDEALAQQAVLTERIAQQAATQQLLDRYQAAASEHFDRILNVHSDTILDRLVPLLSKIEGHK